MKPLTPDRHRLTARDVMEAELMSDTDAPLPEGPWQALAWSITGVATCSYGVSADGRAFNIALVANGRKDTVEYLRVAAIADLNGPWVRSIGAERMRVLVLRHADRKQRELGLDALHMLAASDDSDSAPEAVKVARSVRQTILRIVDGHGLDGPRMDPRTRKEIEAEIAVVGAAMKGDEQ